MVYELAILWAIKDSKEINFTPQISVFFGFLLAIASTFIIIYFVHHIAEVVHADNLIARIGSDLESSLNRVLPESGHVAQGSRTPQEVPTDFAARATAFPSPKSGYVQKIDYDALCAFAAEQNLILKLLYRPGEFAIENNKLLYVYSKTELDVGTYQSLSQTISSAFVCGNQRKPECDVEFPIKQLVEIAIRAISPAVNDPFTATRCIDRLTMMLALVLQKAQPSPYRFDRDRQLRLILNPISFETLVNAAFDQIRQYGRTDVSITIRQLEAIAKIGEQCSHLKNKQVLRRQAEMIARGGQNPDNIPEENDRQDIQQQYNKTLQILSRGPKV